MFAILQIIISLNKKECKCNYLISIFSPKFFFTIDVNKFINDKIVSKKIIYIYSVHIYIHRVFMNQSFLLITSYIVIHTLDKFKYYRYDLINLKFNNKKRDNIIKIKNN